MTHVPETGAINRPNLSAAPVSGTCVIQICYRLSTYDRRSFSVAGPTVWNSLPEDMRDPECTVDSYRQSQTPF